MYGSEEVVVTYFVVLSGVVVADDMVVVAGESVFIDDESVDIVVVESLDTFVSSVVLLLEQAEANVRIDKAKKADLQMVFIVRSVLVSEKNNIHPLITK